MRLVRRRVLRATGGALTALCLAGSTFAQEATPPAPPDVQTPAPAPAPSPQPAPSPAPAKKKREPIIVRDHRTVRSFPANLGHNIVEVWNPHSLRPLLIGGAAAGALSFLDDNTVNYFADHPHDSWGNVGRIMGGTLAVGAASGALFGVGRYANGDRFRAATYDMGQAMIVNFLYTFALKTTVRRTRPDQSDKYSFPSGHSSNAFALAQVWVEQYGWKAAVPGYLVASFIAGSRLAANKHYLSDITAGATLGIIVGKSVARWDSKPSHKPLPPELTEPKRQITLAPATAPDGSGLGLGVTIRF